MNGREKLGRWWEGVRGGEEGRRKRGVGKLGGGVGGGDCEFVRIELKNK